MVIPVQIMMGVAAFFALVLSILGVSVWRTRRRYAGCPRWPIANLLYALGLLLFALRSVAPNWFGVVGANAAVVAAATLSLEAARKYCGLRPRVTAVYAGGVLTVLAVVYFRCVTRNINASIVAMSAFMGVLAVLCFVTLHPEWRARRRLGVA